MTWGAYLQVQGSPKHVLWEFPVGGSPLHVFRHNALGIPLQTIPRSWRSMKDQVSETPSELSHYKGTDTGSEKVAQIVMTNCLAHKFGHLWYGKGLKNLFNQVLCLHIIYFIVAQRKCVFAASKYHLKPFY